MGGKKDSGPSSRRLPSRYTTCLQQGARVHQTHATPHGRKGQNQIYALHPRNPSLVRRGQPPNPLPYLQISPQKIWTLSHQEGSIRCLVQTRTSGTMEDTSGDPRKPPNTL